MARARLARVGRGFGWRGLVAGLTLALAAALAGPAGALPAQAATTGTGTAAAAASACGHVTGPFSVSGTQVLGADQKPFVSYGITVPGLQGPDWASFTALDLQKITATADQWCANTVRLQLNQDDLLGPGGTGVDEAYLAAIEAEVSLAEQDHLVVVLNDETNLSPPPAQYLERGPTPATETFWKVLTNIYGDDPQVIFDLFNEPRMYSAGMSQAQEWHLWLDGGLYQGVYYPFGMAQLAAYVRTTMGAHNLFWIEGPNFSASFAGMIQQHALLHVSGVVYALHHPGGQPGPTAWNDDFGYLVTEGIAPVVNGEFTNYEPAPNPKIDLIPGYCWPNAPTAVPLYLQYLTDLGIGVSAYQLVPGWLIKSDRRLGSPTSINPKTWNCQPDRETEPDQSAGKLIMAYFKQRNG